MCDPPRREQQDSLLVSLRLGNVSGLIHIDVHGIRFSLAFSLGFDFGGIRLLSFEDRGHRRENEIEIEPQSY